LRDGSFLLPDTPHLFPNLFVERFAFELGSKPKRGTAGNLQEAVSEPKAQEFKKTSA